MIKYSELIEKTMPPEKKASASRCVVGHYFVRPISNIISIPLIEKHVSPTKVTMISGLFPFISLIFFIMFPGNIGFWGGWLSILIWNVLDGVDGNIARYNSQCSDKGALWDATVGWLAIISFFIGMGFVAYYDAENNYILPQLPREIYLILGNASAIGWIFPRLIMHKKSNIMGSESVNGIQDRKNYSLSKLLLFNLTSVNGVAAVLFLVSFLFHFTEICVIGYFILIMLIACGSLYSLLK